MGKKSLQSFRSYLHFWENLHVVCKFLKLRAVFRLKMPGLKGISLIGDGQWSKVVYKRVKGEASLVPRRSRLSQSWTLP